MRKILIFCLYCVIFTLIPATSILAQGRKDKKNKPFPVPVAPVPESDIYNLPPLEITPDDDGSPLVPETTAVNEGEAPLTLEITVIDDDKSSPAPKTPAIKEEISPPVPKAPVVSEEYKGIEQNIAAAVPHADVVIINPTHYAVALKNTMPRPIVIAKGADERAALMRDLARENDVLLVENTPLAQALFRETEVWDYIPEAYYAEVAMLFKSMNLYGNAVGNAVVPPPPPPPPPVRTVVPTVNIILPPIVPPIAPPVTPPAVPPAPPPAAPPAYRPSMNVTPGMPDPCSNGVYRVQVGSFSNAGLAQQCFNRLKSAGFTPYYEQYGSLYRVVITGIQAADMAAVIRRLESAGFTDAWIREER